jgi:hypothetical protein
MERVTVEIDSTWAKIARSPLYFVIVALQGVSVTFAPLFLYWSGKGGYFPGMSGSSCPCVSPLSFLFLCFIFGSPAR